eukprot:197882-Rhodomonas_salina.1
MLLPGDEGASGLADVLSQVLARTSLCIGSRLPCIQYWPSTPSPVLACDMLLCVFFALTGNDVFHGAVQCGALKELNLCSNKIGDEGGRRLAAAFGAGRP